GVSQTRGPGHSRLRPDSRSVSHSLKPRLSPQSYSQGCAKAEHQTVLAPASVAHGKRCSKPAVDLRKDRAGGWISMYRQCRGNIQEPQLMSTSRYPASAASDRLPPAAAFVRPPECRLRASKGAVLHVYRR